MSAIVRDRERITIVGKVDVHNRASLKEMILDAIADDLQPIVDLRDAGYLDSSAHATLIACTKESRAFNRGPLVLANANEDLRAFLEESGLAKLFDFVEDAKPA